MAARRPDLAQQPNRAASLRRLVAWYGRVSTDVAFIGTPPLDGLDALVDELMGVPPSDGFTRLASARWAVLVCEELVRYRARCRCSAQAAPATTSAALDRLELAFTAARRHLSENDLDPKERATAAASYSVDPSERSQASVAMVEPEEART